MQAYSCACHSGGVSMTRWSNGRAWFEQRAATAEREISGVPVEGGGPLSTSRWMLSLSCSRMAFQIGCSSASILRFRALAAAGPLLSAGAALVALAAGPPLLERAAAPAPSESTSRMSSANRRRQTHTRCVHFEPVFRTRRVPSLNVPLPPNCWCVCAHGQAYLLRFRPSPRPRQQQEQHQKMRRQPHCLPFCSCAA